MVKQILFIFAVLLDFFAYFSILRWEFQANKTARKVWEPIGIFGFLAILLNPLLVATKRVWMERLDHENGYTLQRTRKHIPPNGKAGKSSSKCHFWWDMLVAGRVHPWKWMAEWNLKIIQLKRKIIWINKFLIIFGEMGCGCVWNFKNLLLRCWIRGQMIFFKDFPTIIRPSRYRYWVI